MERKQYLNDNNINKTELMELTFTEKDNNDIRNKFEQYMSAIIKLTNQWDVVAFELNVLEEELYKAEKNKNIEQVRLIQQSIDHLTQEKARIVKELQELRNN